MDSTRKGCTKVPVLKITINKKYNNHHNNNNNGNDNNISFAPYRRQASKGSRAEGSIRANLTNYDARIDRKDAVTDWLEIGASSVRKLRAERSLDQEGDGEGRVCRDAVVGGREERRMCKRSWECKGDLSRENVRNWTRAEKLRHLNTKTQRELEILSIRLKALKERHRYEKKEILKLHKYLSVRCRDGPLDSLEDPSGKERISESEDEYEKLLREVRKMKETLEETALVKTLKEGLDQPPWEDKLQRSDATNCSKVQSYSATEETVIEIKEEFIDYSLDNC